MTMMNNNDVLDNILEICVYRNVSMYGLAKMTGLTRQLTHQWVKNKKLRKGFNPCLDNLFIIAKVLKVPIQLFFDERSK